MVEVSQIRSFYEENDQQFVWSVTLDNKSSEYEWNPQTESEEEDSGSTKSGSSGMSQIKPSHKLKIKQGFLGTKVKEGEINVVQMSCVGFQNKEILVPVLAMKGGLDLQRILDQEIPTKAKLTLVQGKGPIHLVGTHHVDMYSYDEEDSMDGSKEAPPSTSTTPKETKEESTKNGVSHSGDDDVTAAADANDDEKKNDEENKDEVDQEDKKMDEDQEDMEQDEKTAEKTAEKPTENKKASKGKKNKKAETETNAAANENGVSKKKRKNDEKVEEEEDESVIEESAGKKKKKGATKKANAEPAAEVEESAASSGKRKKKSAK